MAYTYLLGWPEKNVFYYGVRYAKNCHPKELCSSYFTSSKHVKKFIESNGLPNIIEIRKTFTDANKARLWEHKVLKRLDVIKKDKWLNKTDNISISTDSCLYEHTPKIRLKKSLSHIGKKHSEETKRKISESQKGKSRLYLLGKKRPEHSEKMKQMQSQGGFALKNKLINTNI